ncbi:MAG: hypothetical protein RSF83_08440 [Hungatella sp.]
MKMTCPECHAVFTKEEDNIFCPKCGTIIDPEVIIRRDYGKKPEEEKRPKPKNNSLYGNGESRIYGWKR